MIRFNFKFGGTSEETRSREIISLDVVWSSVCPQSCLGTTYADAHRWEAILMQRVWQSEYTEQSPHTAYDDSHGREGIRACDYRSSQKWNLDSRMRSRHMCVYRNTQNSHLTRAEGIHVRQVQQTVQTQLHPVEAFENPRRSETVRLQCVWLCKVYTCVRNHKVAMSVVESSTWPNIAELWWTMY